MIWTIQKLLEWAVPYFEERGIETPRLDAELLLAQVLNRPRIQLYTHFDQPLSEEELQTFKNLLKRRAAREPLAYILGEREFFSLAFKVNSHVLIPRPETEELVERGLAHLGSLSNSEPRILDLATGSGCLLTALLKNFPAATGIGVDISEEALSVARGNAEAIGVAGRVQWIQHDLSREWPPELAGPFDLITANLPYVSEGEYLTLQPEIREYEPKEALVPGEAGTEAFAWVLPQLPSRMGPESLALLEIGWEQKEALTRLAGEHCEKQSLRFERDLAGKDRILCLKESPGN